MIPLDSYSVGSYIASIMLFDTITTIDSASNIGCLMI
jgi:hypothetical protein